MTPARAAPLRRPVPGGDATGTRPGAGLEVSGLHKSFGGLTVADDISLTLRPGDRKALIGPNGAGKSTFANLITGILSPTSGRIALDGRDIGALDEPARVRLGLARTFQITTLFRSLTARENLRLAVLERTRRAQVWWRRAGTDPAVEDEVSDRLATFRLTGVADRPVAHLAYGQQRLVELALTLALRPRVLILDEPAAGVPGRDGHLIDDALAALPEDLAVLIIEHDMDLVFRFAETIIVLVQGRILIEGRPADIAANAEVRRLYLGQGRDA